MRLLGALGQRLRARRERTSRNFALTELDGAVAEKSEETRKSRAPRW